MLDEVKSLVDRTIDISLGQFYPPNAIREYKNYHDRAQILEDSRNGYMIIVRQEGRIVGTGTLRKGMIMRILIDPESQMRGIGRRIMDHLEEKARQQNLNQIELQATVIAKDFYLRRGYVLNKSLSEDVGDGQFLDYHEMSKMLGK